MPRKSSISLDDMPLPAAAKRVRVQLTDAELKELLKAPALGQKAALQRLDDLPKPIADKAIVAAVMAMQKARCSEGDFTRAFQHIKMCHADYSPSWLKGARDLCMALIEAQEEAERGGSGADNIVNFSGFRSMVQFTLDGLEQINARRPTLFRHGTELARIVQVSEEDSAKIQILNLDQFSAALPVHFEKKKDKRLESAPPPVEVAKKVYHTPNLPLPYLAALTRFPTFGEDGSLQTEPGYSTTTQTFYAPPVGMDIPAVGGWGSEGARQRDVAKARRLLVEELLADFPFDGWNRDRIMDAFHGRSGERLPASLMNALAILVTPFVRAMIAGPVPLSLVSKPQAGTGATYLVELVQMLVSGTPNARAPLSASEEERRKALFTCVKAGEAVALYDNQKGTLDSPVLASVLTGNTLTDRVLGRSEERSLPIRSIFAMTANNLILSEELQRRINLVRMDAKTADPKNRDGWRHPSLHAWAEVNRGELLWAILTLVQNWIHRGCQGPNHCPAVASYGGWCFVIGGVLEAADDRWAAFQGNRADIALFAAAGEEQGFAELVAAWAATGGDRTAAELAEIMEAENIEIEDVKIGRDGAPSAVSLGIQLAAYNGRRFAIEGREVELFCSGERRRAKVWALRDMGVAASAAGSDNGPALGPRVPSRYRSFPTHPDPVESGEGAGEAVVRLEDQPSPFAENRHRRGSRALVDERRKARRMVKSA